MNSYQQAQTAIPCTNPANGEYLGDVAIDTPDDVKAAVARAREAQKAWANSTFKQRRAVLNHISDYILENVDDVCELIVKDAGKTYENALLGEVMPTCNKIKWLNKYGEKHLKSEKVGSGLLMHKKGRIEYVPLGVVGCIIPWNYPLQNIISSLVAPLMAGNAVILKPSEQVAFASNKFVKITNQALEKEGFSKDTVQLVQGYGDTGAALISARVDKILFIGSVGNGRRIIQASAEHITPVVMELGGKDPMIICDDAHLEKAVHSAIGGCFINLGQNCVASERIIVMAPMYDKFCQRAGEIANSLRQGEAKRGGNVDVGAMTTPIQVDITEKLVTDAIAKGATVLAGGKRPEGNGCFYPPTILTDLTDDMDIVTTEVFGPVMLVFKANDEEHAIAMANDSNLGLQSSVITHDRARGDRIASRIESGAVCINDFGLCYVNQDLPFGGTKYSGYGVMNGRDGLRAYTTPKAILADRFPLEIPPALFPVGSKDYDSAKASMRLLFGRGIGYRLKNLMALIGVSIMAKFSK
ncbi:Putative succinate-semialdehyde dehydrogenase [NADP(+)] 2 [BD1-7 clade bacterium]|uniref:Aldehyde dehydrogenase n=1 Tax=BD1-7 clade bacterium TaxID=2029982 RepID=A0A5S9MV06_9GAMM|nr:Putative succinate-semialdehyde dehydrogenase [NADP(+)] 2 [BD1-7 clade bacterium]